MSSKSSNMNKGITFHWNYSFRLRDLFIDFRDLRHKIDPYVWKGGLVILLEIAKVSMGGNDNSDLIVCGWED